ncbi:MAG: hypothetical protein Q7S58_01525 [Candidatus Binatus sp.]|nr:hypothetical protein [Candidatus Binatus sp.]MDO8431070.1 hypothetical protein [Candidatus Binatus sp.]
MSRQPAFDSRVRQIRHFHLNQHEKVAAILRTPLSAKMHQLSDGS